MYQIDKRKFISLGAFLERPPGVRQAGVNRGTDCGTSLGKLTVRKVATANRTDDPAGIVIDAALPRNAVELRHLPALPHEEAAKCIARVRGRTGVSESSKLALEFLVLTAARSGEVRKATWDEIDLDGGTWTVPAERMNGNRERRVPLSRRALEVLAAAAELSDGSGLVFPGMRRDRPLSENTHAKLLREPGFDAVTHGFRSSFRDYAAERTHTPHAVMDAALARVVRNQAEAAYARSEFFEKRRALMQSWSDYLAGSRPLRRCAKCAGPAVAVGGTRAPGTRPGLTEWGVRWSPRLGPECFRVPAGRPEGTILAPAPVGSMIAPEPPRRCCDPTSRRRRINAFGRLQP